MYMYVYIYIYIYTLLVGAPGLGAARLPGLRGEAPRARAADLYYSIYYVMIL